MTEVVHDPVFPDRVSINGAPMTPCRVTAVDVMMAPAGKPRAPRPGFNAVYDTVRQYSIRYDLPPAEPFRVAPAGLDAAIRGRLEAPALAAVECRRAAEVNAWTSGARAALLAVLERHKPTYYDDRIEYERREEPVFAADGTPRGVVEVRGEPLPPDWCAPCAEVTPCDEVRDIAKSLGIEVLKCAGD